MKVGINIKIDVTKIDKAKLHKGAKGTYLDLVAFVELVEKDTYGQSGMVTQGQTKEEKAAGIKSAILGNSAIFWDDDEMTAYKNGGVNAAVAEQDSHGGTSAPPKNDFDDDIPF